MILQGFHHTYVVVGSITKGTESVDGVRTELYFTTVGKETANGVFFGDGELSKKLGRLLLAPGKVRFSGKWSSKNASHRIEFIVEGIDFNKYQGPMETDRLCEFKCNQLIAKVIGEDEEAANKTTAVRICYSIPYRRELIKLKIESDLTPGYKDWLEYESKYGKIKIEYLPHADKAKIGVNHGKFLVHELQLSVEVEYEGEELLCEQLTDIDELIESYLLLISIICLGKTDYHKKVITYLDSNGYERNQTFQIFDRKNYQQQQHFMLFEWQTVDELLKDLIPKLNVHRNKYEILETVKLFTSAIHSEYVEVKLLILQGAIETAVNAVYELLGVEKQVCPNCKNDLVRLRDKLIAVLNTMNVRYDDLYPSVANSQDITFPFIKYRNSFVHGRRNQIDYIDIDSETYRQQYLVERLIMNWIGYDSNKLKYLEMWKGIKPF